VVIVQQNINSSPCRPTFATTCAFTNADVRLVHNDNSTLSTCYGAIETSMAWDYQWFWCKNIHSMFSWLHLRVQKTI